MYAENERIIPVCIEDEMKGSYLSYAMSVIVGRALPDVKDGLKPVHRRILYAMHELNLDHTKPYKKSARIVGEALGKFHPHGDTAVYDTLVRMVQDFSLRYPLVDGQGNFGCFTKDTKIRLADGRSLTFGELIKEHKEGRKNYTFAINAKSKKIEIAEIKNPRKTRLNAEVIKVTLDNGEEIRCTPDHLFMLRNGVYKKAKELKGGDSLMPLYLKHCDGKNDPALKGYEQIYQPSQENWELTHHLADEQNRRCGLPHLKTAMKYFSDAEESRNHKVNKVEFLKYREDVYDLTIDRWHNFALAAGIFVHNSVDGDAAAAMRYTEARLAAISNEMLSDIEKDTVDFVPNFDASLQEPVLLPSVLPNLLVNGSSGIAVGMATNVPPHNLTEVIDGICSLIDNPEAEIKELMRFIKGPDFPTGGIICGRDGIKDAFNTGRGKITLRARASIERQKSGKDNILITEIPYQVNKTTLIESIADLVQEKKIEGISDIRDESDKDGMRVVIELKRDSEPQIILNQLYKHTQLETTFGIIALALVEGRPRVLNLKQIIRCYIDHRKVIIRRRTQFDLDKALKRAHILEGLKIALKHLDRIIKTIRASKNTPEAKKALMKNFELSDLQAQAILEMQLQRLTALEREKIDAEYLELLKQIERFRAILASEKLIEGIIKDELAALKKKYGDERRTEIIGEVEDIEIEDLIAEEDMVITISHAGYIKRLAISAYRKQKRGGKGVTAMETREEDFVERLFVASTKDYLLVFTDQGRLHWIKVYEIPQASRQSKGKAIINLLQVGAKEKVAAVLPVKEFSDNKSIILCSKKGVIKKTVLSAFANPRKGGIVAMGLDKDDAVMEAKLTDANQDILIATRQGKAIRFKEKQIREMGRQAKGVRGISLAKKDEVVGMEIISADLTKTGATILTVTSCGFAKRTVLDEYRIQSRGGKGIINVKVTAKNGEAVALNCVLPDDELMTITQQGMMVRCPVKDIRETGRNAQGVRLIALDKNDAVTSVAKIVAKEEE
jgi:DNA gyrase subunit A